MLIFRVKTRFVDLCIKYRPNIVLSEQSYKDVIVEKEWRYP